MSASLKRSVFTFIAAMVMAAFSTLFAITLARLMSQHRAEDDGASAGADPGPAASASES